MSLPFAYRLRYQRRKTLAVHVLDDATVEVRAPHGWSETAIRAWVRTRTDWVTGAQQRARQRKRRATALHWTLEGGSAPFLGQMLTLDIQPGRSTRIERSQQTLHIRLPPPMDRERVESVLDRWYLAQTRPLFEQRFDLGITRFRQQFGDAVLPHSLKLRRMRRRWGSCSRDGVITLNRELIKLPLALTDYVIAHELCHLLEFNHSPRFYALLTTLMPDWRERESVLREC